MKIISLREEPNSKLEKVLKNTAIVFAALFVLSLILGGSISSWFTQRVNDHAASVGESGGAQMFTALAEYMSDMFTSDLLTAFALLTLTFGLIYFYITSKINRAFLIVGLAVIILFDLIRSGNRRKLFDAEIVTNNLESRNIFPL